MSTVVPHPPAAVPAVWCEAAHAAGTVRARFEDLGAACRAERALLAAGVAASAVRVRGRRVTTGLREYRRRGSRRSPRRLRVNVAVALLAGLLVGPPVGASAATLVLGRAPAVMWLGGIVAAAMIAGTGAVWAWAEHHQLVAGSTLPSRLEGLVVVTAESPPLLEQVERLLRAAPGALDVARGWAGVDVLVAG